MKLIPSSLFGLSFTLNYFQTHFLDLCFTCSRSVTALVLAPPLACHPMTTQTLRTRWASLPVSPLWAPEHVAYWRVVEPAWAAMDSEDALANMMPLSPEAAFYGDTVRLWSNIAEVGEPNLEPDLEPIDDATLPLSHNAEPEAEAEPKDFEPESEPAPATAPEPEAELC